MYFGADENSSSVYTGLVERCVDISILQQCTEAMVKIESGDCEKCTLGPMKIARVCTLGSWKRCVDILVLQQCTEAMVKIVSGDCKKCTLVPMKIGRVCTLG